MLASSHRYRAFSRVCTAKSAWWLCHEACLRSKLCFMEPPRGFEPRTLGLRYRCSTTELRRLNALPLLAGRSSAGAERRLELRRLNALPLLAGRSSAGAERRLELRRLNALPLLAGRSSAGAERRLELRRRTIKRTGTHRIIHFSFFIINSSLKIIPTAPAFVPLLKGLRTGRSLLIAHGFDGLETRRLFCGIQTECNTCRRRHEEREEDGGKGEGEAEFP